MVLAIALSVLIGVTLGLLGGGGSILTVPILVYVVELEPKRAIATSLLVVGCTSVAAMIPHARGLRVQWRTGLIFGAAGMAGAFAGGRIAHFIPGGVLLLAFGATMLVAAAAMMRGRKAAADETIGGPKHLPIPMVLAQGALVGAFSGLVGAGGGFLVVPALVLLGGLPMGVAVGTSLVVIAMQSFAGFAGYMGHVSIDWRLAAMVTAAAVAGSVVGGLLAGRVPQALLRKAFAWFVVAMAMYILGRQLPPAVLAAHWPWLLMAAAAVVGGLLALQIRSSRAARAQGAAPQGAAAASRVPSPGDHAPRHEAQAPASGEPRPTRA